MGRDRAGARREPCAMTSSMTSARSTLPQPPAGDGAYDALLRLMVGPWIAQAIFVAAKLDIAGRLREGPRASDALAAASGADPDALYRVLRALASVGVFAEQDDRQF